jgi:hypothetical protein
MLNYHRWRNPLLLFMNILKRRLRLCLERRRSVGGFQRDFKARVLPVLVAALFSLPTLKADVRFNRDVRPILSENCLGCHGPDAEQRKGKLRLDRRDDAMKPAESGEIAIVPGEPERSSLVDRINTADRTELMPPPKSHKALSERQREILSSWISEGAKYEEHWSFTPVQRPKIPSVKNAQWPRTPIDFFVLERLEHAGLLPGPEASPETLRRRMAFDITGLPPAAGERPSIDLHLEKEAWLSSVQHGEHLARHWMDVARYADSAGFELDSLFSHAWEYRDWLIRSFSSNKPLDRFIQEQIAGDALWPGNDDAKAGVLFLSIGPIKIQSAGIRRPEEDENERLTDLVDTTGAAFLGLTMGCSRCHDHKFDPVTQNDYYGIQALFSDSKRVVSQERQKQGTAPITIGLQQNTSPARVKVLRRGELEMPVRDATPSLPAAFPGGGAVENPARGRSALALWLTRPDHPLTARVMVNRIWQWYFGKGLVRTAGDFGSQGESPSHPKLLNWLASELTSNHWDLRHIERLILNSATYRQSSIPSAEVKEADPEGHLLGAFPRRRLRAEELRDALLFVSGKLNLTPFGPPITPPVEPWALTALRNKNWSPTKDERELARRSLYLIVRRSIKLPFFDAFNSPDTVSSCSARESTVVASQALTLLNSDDSLHFSRELAGRLWRESRGDATQAIHFAWRRLFSRDPSPSEHQKATAFLRAREAAWSKMTPYTKVVPSEFDAGKPLPSQTGAAWVEWCLALINCNEFAYVD